MKKYLYLLFVALFATMSFALTSCGDDDDDEPTNGKYSYSLTVDGKKFPAKTIADETWNHNGFDALTVWINDAADDAYIIFETTKIDGLTNGVNISDDCSFDMDFNDTFLMGAEVKSGSVTVGNVDLSAKTITVNFDKTVFYSRINGDEVTLNGTLTSPLNGADNKVKL